MDTHTEYLEIVDENEQVVGRAPRDQVHDEGLLHREVHVWFVTSSKEIVFQKRALTKDTEPGLLDATAGGHIDEGCSPIEAALTEVYEETGQQLAPNDLHLLGKVRKNTATSNGRINNVIRYVYGYHFIGLFNDLVAEAGGSDGFVLYKLQQLQQLNEGERKKFVKQVIGPEYLQFFQTLTTF